jgi:Flp pilus assembly protein TadB
MPLRSAKSRKRLSWWRRSIDEKRFGIFGTRAGATLLIGMVVILIENPWLIAALLVLAASGAIFAFAIRRSNQHETPSILGSKRE